MVSLRVGTMQLHKLHKHALELEQSGGRRGRAEVEGLGGGKRWAEKGKGGHTMTTMCNLILLCMVWKKHNIWWN